MKYLFKHIPSIVWRNKTKVSQLQNQPKVSLKVYNTWVKYFEDIVKKMDFLLARNFLSYGAH